MKKTICLTLSIIMLLFVAGCSEEDTEATKESSRESRREIVDEIEVANGTTTQEVIVIDDDETTPTTTTAEIVIIDDEDPIESESSAPIGEIDIEIPTAPTEVITISPDLVEGDRIEFGNYNGAPIQWRVISKRNDKIELMTENIVCERPFSDTTENVTWETCSLRAWLNNEFYNSAFSAMEQRAIVTTTVVASDISDVNPDVFACTLGEWTQDKVFLLNFFDASNNGYLRNHWSTFDSSWWTCSQCISDPSNASFVDRTTSYYSGLPLTDSCGVRPVIWLSVG